MNRKQKKQIACIIFLGLFVVLWIVSLFFDKKQVELKDGWQTLQNCALIMNHANDGDSFHVSHKGNEYVFRLYYVDTPEKSGINSERLTEQAEYFGIDNKQAMELGKEATVFTEGKLLEPFTVITRFRDALGNSALGREYAFVITSDGQDLGMLLVSNGLARIFGTSVGKEIQWPLKDVNRGDYKHGLYSAQKRAKESGVGGWR